MGRPRVEMTGSQVGKWTVLSPAGLDNRGNAQWLCRCECGAEKPVRGKDLRRGISKSCGLGECANNFKHGKRSHYLYNTWHNMRYRCSNPNATGFKNYGGRGITVSSRWEDFEAFLSDMGDRPEGMSIDRIDNDGNYEPGNCRWATSKEQRLNQRAA